MSSLCLKFASYNIHKGVGLDRRRDPDRILSILREIDADVIALQEADRRFGSREAVIPRQSLDEHSPWQAAAPGMRPLSMGWHGNVLLVRREIEILDVRAVALPTLEPRGAVCADLASEGRRFRVVGMHLDLSGLRRRHQVRAVCDHVAEGEAAPVVIMGDLNEWSLRGGALAEFDPHLTVLSPGRSFPARRPLAELDRIVVSQEWGVGDTGVHHSPLSAVGSDHLPVFASLTL
ncbi:endonuclease/exonuclease/phosphatase family protein [Novosphingobium sp. KCTC 2891]|uniref:endonuclease/exonuclease/phosphatase family protein n=1 Tax=Novosphingobium sp. KCTC 2891 TaxID=2989730 RepID=UPI002221C632|nr:endonuclease/exonuclease/phosphatase family protein [Novosphingobium sp. KCTC 2891]MCW1383057.1 endonuclease/exonuclease/phosphatase family protein [Novosphingobium sp. KCTC 2891]